MNIIIPNNSSLNFDNFNLDSPKALRGGSYLTQLTNNGNKIYIQIPKCTTKGGIIVTEKKTYCDLMFSSTNTSHLEFINWMESLENKLHKLIYSKKDLWFTENIDLIDIETNFNSPIRIYKSGKFYLVRVQIINNINSNNIYD